MADIYSVTAPLIVRPVDEEPYIAAERFKHPQGMLVFEPFWFQSEQGDAIHLLDGDVQGEGPWKIDRITLSVLSCGDTRLSMLWNEWQAFLNMPSSDGYISALHEVARDLGSQISE